MKQPAAVQRSGIEGEAGGSKGIALVLSGVLVVLILLISTSSIWINESEKPGPWIFFLFVIPVALQLIISIASFFCNYQIHNKYVIGMFFSIISYITLLTLYYLNNYLLVGFLDFLSWLCLCLIAILVAISAWIASILSTPHEAEPEACVDSQGRPASGREAAFRMELLGDNRFHTICYFLAVFISISYLFAFAFAFHDKARRASDRIPALYSVDYRSILEEAQGSKLARSPGKSGGGVDQSVALQGPGAGKSQPAGSCFPLVFFQPDSTDPYQGSPHRYVNKRMIKAAVARIHEIGSGKRIRVTLAGHAKKSSTSDYMTNYHFSSSRSATVMRLLQTELQRSYPDQWFNIEWQILPKSSAQDFIGVEGVVDLTRYLESSGDCASQDRYLSQEEITGKLSKHPLDPWLSVEIEIMSVADDPGHVWARYQNVDYCALTLIDYVYFSVYTITTTGYGDIIPITAYSKFLSSISNFCELFFIVIFFNILLITKPPRRPMPVVVREIVEQVVGDGFTNATDEYTKASDASAERSESRMLQEIKSLEERLNAAITMGRGSQLEGSQLDTCISGDEQE